MFSHFKWSLQKALLVGVDIQWEKLEIEESHSNGLAGWAATSTCGFLLVRLGILVSDWCATEGVCSLPSHEAGTVPLVWIMAPRQKWNLISQWDRGANWTLQAPRGAVGRELFWVVWISLSQAFINWHLLNTINLSVTPSLPFVNFFMHLLKPHNVLSYTV